MTRRTKDKLSQKEVEHIADLAQLPLTKKEIQKFQKQLSDILDHIALLNKIDTSQIKPTSQVTGLQNVSRQDQKGRSEFSATQALGNAPKTHKGYFKTKGVFEE